MQIKFWGSRGSSPATLTHDRVISLLEKLVEKAKAEKITSMDTFLQTAKSGKWGNPLSFGGHTPCVEITHEAQQFFIDMGTGLREAGAEYFGKQNEFTFFITHMHWDHLMGLPFFPQIFTKGNKITFYHVHKHAPESVKLLFNGVNFPITWDKLGAEIQFKQIEAYQKVEFGNVQVTPFTLDHPGASFGYRFEAGGKSLAVGFDGEYKRISRAALGRDLPFYQNLDLLIFDAQYALDDLLSKFDWGHSSPHIGIDLALREGIKSLVLIHHDPSASWEWLQDSELHAKNYLQHHLPFYLEQWKDQPEGPKVVSAYDGLKLSV